MAYQVFGEGDVDIVFVHGLISHLDLFWDWSLYARFMERLGSFARVIVFDKRGVGLSDRVSDLPPLEERMDDVRAVMDAAGSERAAVFGISEGAPMSALFAASYPTASRRSCSTAVRRCPTLVLHRRGDGAFSLHGGRWMAEQIPGARFQELSGRDHLPWIGDQDAVLDEVEEFLTGVRGATAPDRVLVTVLFTDIVDSTSRAAELGDEAWRRLRDRHHELIRRYLTHFRGREVDTAGDGFLAVFDGPGRAVRCAREVVAAVRSLGLEVRAGVHTGEVELRGDGVAGLAVHIGARVAGLAGAGEVLTTRTVKDLVAGSGISCEDRGTHELKGVPDTWQVYAAVDS